MYGMKLLVFAAAFAAAGAGLAVAAPTKPQTTSAPLAAAGDPVRGKTVYVRCGGCHSIDQNRIGPKHRGVVGRKAGSVAGYDYSPAVKKSKVTWTTDKLEIFLSGPTKFIPGTRMGFSLSSPQDRADVIAYLATQK